MSFESRPAQKNTTELPTGSSVEIIIDIDMEEGDEEWRAFWQVVAGRPAKMVPRDAAVNGRSTTWE